MKINKYDFTSGAREARGCVVIIDVFRAFTTACYAFANNAAAIIAVVDSNRAIELKSENPNIILMGERHGKKINGFDHGNSPAEIKRMNFSGKTLVLTTHAGTQGLVNASYSKQLFTGSFVNAKATVKKILSYTPSEVSLVRMGWAASESTSEDDLCSDYFKSLLLNQKFDTDRIKSTLESAESSKRFFDEDKPWSPVEDFYLCLEIDKFDFALQAEAGDNGVVYINPVK